MKTAHVWFPFCVYVYTCSIAVKISHDRSEIAAFQNDCRGCYQTPSVIRFVWSMKSAFETSYTVCIFPSGVPSDQSSGTSSPLCDSGLHLNYHPNNTVHNTELKSFTLGFQSGPIQKRLPPLWESKRAKLGGSDSTTLSIVNHSNSNQLWTSVRLRMPKRGDSTFLQVFSYPMA